MRHAPAVAERAAKAAGESYRAEDNEICKLAESAEADVTNEAGGEFGSTPGTKRGASYSTRGPGTSKHQARVLAATNTTNGLGTGDGYEGIP